ncbi:MAG TPA: sigma-70 family RNA polymerase sigma factor [Panacibacter sp.]|nr:sigma-70 family RNA polymerase sigma factor [Panacibacter sp.]
MGLNFYTCAGFVHLTAQVFFMHSSQPAHINQLVDHLFRHESGKMVAVITKLLGIDNLETAQDIVQDTLLKAMTTWSFGKIPDNPAAWLYHVAKNKAIDFLRREKSFKKIGTQYAQQNAHTTTDTHAQNIFLENEIQDSQLRMMFACCHPQIPQESQIALALKTLCGMGVHEIAQAFLTTDETISKRIYRAKEKIRNEKIKLEVPAHTSLTERLETVLHTLYLLFNEGYNSSHIDKLIRDDLCEDAMRLCHLLTQQQLTSQPSVKALLSLMCFQSSRLMSRIDEKGNIITLKYQDRATWNMQLIQKGFDYLDEAAEGNHFSTYHLEAGIASLHAASPAFERTDWKGVYHLYEILYSINPSPVIALYKAIASAYAISMQSALDALQQIKGLEKNHLYYATLGEMCLGLNKKMEAKNYFLQALALTISRSERQLLNDKIGNCN